MEYLRLSRYDPNHKYRSDETWTSYADIGRTFEDGRLTEESYLRIERAYLAAAKAIAMEALVGELTVASLEFVREPAQRPQIEEGLRLPLDHALEVLRRELRGDLSCRLVDGRFYIDVGLDYYLYVGVDKVSQGTLSEIIRLGLHVERDLPSPFLGDRSPSWTV